MKLLKREIQVFREITLNTPKTLLELAEATSTSRSYLSTTLSNMKKKGLVEKTRNGLQVTPQIANTFHASILRDIILNTPQNNLGYLTNKGIVILSAITCHNLDTTEELLEASGVSYKTLWKFMDKARKIGLIQKKNGITINPRYEQVTKFVEAFTRFTHETEAREHADDALIKWSCGEGYIFETQESLPLQGTGISAFHDYGALFLTRRNLYTSSVDQLRLEDHLINHILSEGQENILPLLITWRLNLAGLDRGYIQKIAYRYKVPGIADAVQRYLDTEGKKKPAYIISWTEFNEKYRDYRDE